MTPILYAHPFSSYCWKVLIALRENATPFDLRQLGDPAQDMAWKQRWPFAKMPVLVDGDAVVPETTVIIEHLQLCYPGPVQMIPSDARAALQVRLLDRVSDNYLMTPMQQIVGDRIRPEADRDRLGVERARALLDTAYGWWNDHMRSRQWAAEAFGLADCATAPALFYADWVHPIPESLSALRGYRSRLLGRPSIARVVDDARPFRPLFPSGDPGRD